MGRRDASSGSIGSICATQIPELGAEFELCVGGPFGGLLRSRSAPSRKGLFINSADVLRIIGMRTAARARQADAADKHSDAHAHAQWASMRALTCTRSLEHMFVTTGRSSGRRAGAPSERASERSCAAEALARSALAPVMSLGVHLRARDLCVRALPVRRVHARASDMTHRSASRRTRSSSSLVSARAASSKCVADSERLKRR